MKSVIQEKVNKKPIEYVDEQRVRVSRQIGSTRYWYGTRQWRARFCECVKAI